MAGNAAAGRKSKPPALKLLNGSPGKDGRVNDSGGREVKPPPAFHREPPQKPSHLSPDASWLWDQITDQMVKVGLLKPLDGASLEVMCETFARWRDAVKMRHEAAAHPERFGSLLTKQERGLLAANSQGKVAAPWLGVEERAGKDFRSWCAEYGITPAAEKNLVADKPESNPGIGGGFSGNPFAGN